jgi:hypothetical protein
MPGDRADELVVLARLALTGLPAEAAADLPGTLDPGLFARELSPPTPSKPPPPPKPPPVPEYDGPPPVPALEPRPAVVVEDGLVVEAEVSVPVSLAGVVA